MRAWRAGSWAAPWPASPLRIAPPSGPATATRTGLPQTPATFTIPFPVLLDAHIAENLIYQ